MQLYREEFLKAIKFLKPAILTDDRPDPLTCLHVKIDATTCVLTAGNYYIGKRVTLTSPMIPEDIEKSGSPQEYADFLIPLSTLLSFETLCLKHKAKFKDTTDLSLKLIDIFKDRLESFKDFITYQQPITPPFPNLFKFFSLEISNMAVVGKIRWKHDLMIDAMKEFDEVVEVYFNGETGHIYFKTESTNQEAFLMPCGEKEVKDDE